MIRLASNSTCLGLVEPLLLPPQKIHRAEILNKIMIEKRISYEEGNGRKNVKVAKKPLPKDWEPKYLNGNVIDITPLIDDPWWEIKTPTSNDDEASAPNGPPFMWEEFLQEKKNGYKGTYQDYLDVIDRSPLDYAKKREGIMRVASLEEDMDRDFYGRLLSPIYKKDYLENLPIN